jgi:Holliday junction resolvasome RuvABC ATP-dependent DNA helicase subunit
MVPQHRDEAARCIDQFREELEGEVDAANLFYEELDALKSAGTSFADLSFCLGFPYHAAGKVLRKRGDDETVLAILERVLERFKEDVVDDAVAQLLEVAQTRYAGDVSKQTSVENALKYLAEEFRRVEPADAENAVRTWRSIFKNNRAQWEVLSAEVLSELLGPSDARPKFAEVVLSSGAGIEVFDVGENHVIVRDRNVAAPAVTATFKFGSALVQHSQDAQAAGTPWNLYASVNRSLSTLASPAPHGKGPHALNVSLPTEGKQSVRFICGPSPASEHAASRVLTLWECSQEYPLIVANAHSKLRPGKRKSAKDAQGNTWYEVQQEIALPAQGRATLQGFVYRVQGNLEMILPGDTSGKAVTGLSAIPSSACHEFVVNTDLGEGAELVFRWKDPSGALHIATVSFEFKGEIAAKDDSVTAVLVRAHGGVGARQIRDLLDRIAKGEALPPGQLPIKDSNKGIARLELHQQAVDRGWWPALLSTGSGIHDQVLEAVRGRSVFRSSRLQLNEQANPWLNSLTPLGGAVSPPPQIAQYAKARGAVIAALEKQFKLSPDESMQDVNLARKASVGLLDPLLLRDYVEAFRSVLKSVRDGSMADGWHWIAWSLDCLLLFEDGFTAPVSQLLGPFHPISLSRLFFAQRCLAQRIRDDQPSPLAHVLAAMEPLALGHVVDAQLQATAGIAFGTGDAHWLWVYRQRGQSELPPVSVLDWLHALGLDPQTGPLGVDAEVLPETLSQYVLAYPSRQRVRLLLEDCSQRAFEVLRDELMPSTGRDDERVRLREKLPSGVAVYDPVTKVRFTDGELIAYDSELALSWHHARAPGSVQMDLATLPRSARVDLQAKKGDGAYSQCSPTARRGLLEYTEAGLEVSTCLPLQPDGSTLEISVAQMLAEFEPRDRRVSWGTSLSMDTGPRSNWTLCSAGQVDPRLFIEYVRKHPDTALWTFRLFELGESKVPEFGRGHFLIARVSTSLASGLQTLVSAAGLTVSPNELLVELAESGLTLGDEFLRTGKTAEGALGQYLAQRLLWRGGALAPLPHWTNNKDGVPMCAGFLLQVDPFSDVLETLPQQKEDGEGRTTPTSRRRGDLVSVHLQFCGEELWIKPVVVESKLVMNGQADIESALAQARATADRLDHLLEWCLHDQGKPHEAFWAQPERLLLAEFVHLGLRLARGSFAGTSDEWHKFEVRVLSKVLSGAFRRVDAQAVVVVHHHGPTKDEVATPLPHALIAFKDSDSARKSPAPVAYAEVQQSLANMVRHACADTGAGKGAAISAVTKAPSAAPASKQPAAPATGTVLPAVNSSSAGVTDLERAHAAFDAAFSDFIGNRQAVERMRDDLVDALIKRPPHLRTAYLFTGNPSTGKTTLANKLARLLGVTFVKVVGTNIKSARDFVDAIDKALSGEGRKPAKLEARSQGLPEFEYPESLVFIDEIHLVKGDEELLTAFEDKDRYVRLRDRICRFPRTTYVGATTRDSDLDKALRTRFGNPIRLKDYTVDEVAQMIAVKDGTWATWPLEVREGIARLSRCTPREAERMAQKLGKKLAVSRERLTIVEALERLRLEEGLDRNGLDQVCWQVLRLLAKESRPIGRDRLAQRLGVVDEEKLVTEVIPSLQTLGLVEQAAGGQLITDRGRNYLRNESPPTSN